MRVRNLWKNSFDTPQGKKSSVRHKIGRKTLFSQSGRINCRSAALRVTPCQRHRMCQNFPHLAPPPASLSFPSSAKVCASGLIQLPCCLSYSLPVLFTRKRRPSQPSQLQPPQPPPLPPPSQIRPLPSKTPRPLRAKSKGLSVSPSTRTTRR